MLQTINKKKVEQGSALVWIIIILIIVIIGLLGYIFWKQMTVVKTPTTPETTISSTQSNTYTSNEGYVGSFSYPLDWRVVEGDSKCADFGYCTSPPELIIADNENTLKATFSIPQSASELTIDDEASSVARDSGNIDTDFTTLDGLDARKIQFTEGTTVILVSLRGSYGTIEFTQPVDTAAVDTILSTWKWL